MLVGIGTAGTRSRTHELPHVKFRSNPDCGAQMQAVPNLFVDSIVQLQSNPAALIALVAVGAFVLIGLALYVVLAAIKRS